MGIAPALRLSRVAGVGLLLLLASGSAWAQVAIPPVARVTDLTGTLTGSVEAGIEAKLLDLEKRKGSQVAVLMLPTTQPEDIEQFGIRVAEAWKLGRKTVDDGAILIVAKDDRKVRIEVGQGLEGALPDAIASRIIAEIITPRFKTGDYDGGVAAGIDQIIAVVNGEPLPEPDQKWERNTGGIGHFFPILLVVVVVAAGVLRSLFGRVGGSLATGGLTGGIAWFLSHWLPIGLGAGVVAFLFALVTGNSRGWSAGGGGWGGGLGGGGFGGGGGGGGFSGGGGGFSGGGASGSW